MIRETDNSADILDTRDLIARIEELRTERESAEEEASEGHAAWNFGAEEREELATLESFLEEMKGYGGDEQWEGDWYPVTLIRDSHWQEYAQDYAEEIGDPDMREAGWPYNCIDWEKAARELQMDYGSAELDGVTYWYR